MNDPRRIRPLGDPGPYERIAAAMGHDRELMSRLVFEQAITVSDGLAGRLQVGAFGHMTDSEISTACLRLATSAMTVLAELGITEGPMTGLRMFALEQAARAEQDEAAA